MPMDRLFRMSFASIHPLYVAKVERKGRSADDVDTVICWLTGYDRDGLRAAIDDGRDLETFFAEAPHLNPDASLITGVICGVRVEEIEDPLTQRIRYMDKLVDEVARGKKMSSILRGSGAPADLRTAPLAASLAPGGHRGRGWEDIVDDLRGSATERLARLDSVVAGGETSEEWLIRQLRAALLELSELEPVVDAEQDRREDY